ERDVGGRSHGLRLAVVERIELGQLVEVLGDQVAETVDRAATLGWRHLRPRTVERAAGGRDGAIDVFGLAVSDGGQNLTSAGIDRLEGRAVGGVDPLSVDQQLAGFGGEASRRL